MGQCCESNAQRPRKQPDKDLALRPQPRPVEIKNRKNSSSDAIPEQTESERKRKVTQIQSAIDSVKIQDEEDELVRQASLNSKQSNEVEQTEF